MSGAAPRRVYTIPSSVPFVDGLAAGLLARSADAPFTLADHLILLPTRRSLGALRDAFLRQSGQALLLPRMRAIDDVDEDELDFAETSGLDDLDVPPQLPSLRREILLSQLVMARDQGGGDPAQAMRLAVDLGRLLDQIHTERLSVEQLADLVPETYAEHWQIILEFLTIVTEHWPAILAEEEAMDGAARRDLLLSRQADAWRRTPPGHPVVVAGSTGSLPATADLMAVIAGFDNGAVVLPGLDQTLDDESWPAVAAEAGHPQHGMALLLARLGADRRSVRPWPGLVPAARLQARAALLSEALRPAETTERWRQLAKISDLALDGLTEIDCPGPQEEALVIALLLRQALEVPGQRAALVTADRTLARRVASALGRWDIVIDDSGGQPLAHTAPGALFILTAAMIAEDFSPVALLAALKHPLAVGGLPPGQFRRAVRALERLCLRGPAPAGGMAGLIDAAERGDTTGALATWLRRLEAACRPLLARSADPAAGFDGLVAAHAGFVEWLAAPADGDENPLWAGEAGAAAAVFIDELLSAARGLPAPSLAQWPALLDMLMMARPVRPRWPLHPRLAIWGPLEARLQQMDVVIIGGLNEGTWPPEARADPWLSRPMRQAFGLPPPERRIGLSAHDFAELAVADRVYLTRASKIDGTPTVPSRWLLRLQSLLHGFGHALRDVSADELLTWARGLEQPDSVCPVPAPAPCPPVEARPRRLSVTAIETLIRDPYSIYARHVLKLEPLDAVAAIPGPAERGIVVHRAFETFFAEADAPTIERLLEHGRAAFQALLQDPAGHAFWWVRFERAAHWFITADADLPARLSSVVEARGRIELALGPQTVTLSAMADRIDRLADGTLAIIDYKTGQVPSKSQVAAGLSPQLPLEAAIAQAGGFENLPAAPVSKLFYVGLGGGSPPGNLSDVGEDVTAQTDDALAGLTALLAQFTKSTTPYRSRPRPMWASRYGTYDHLARVKEWSTQGGGDQ